MTRFRGEASFRHDAPERLGVLLVNLGTPDQPTTSAVRRYLAEFLSDPRVIEVPRPLWWLILHGFILRFRPRKSAAAYAKVWSKNGSPLLHFSRRQALALGIALERTMAGPVVATLAMRYGSPSIPQALQSMQKKNVRRLLILPMFPQYSATTTASVFDAVNRELATWRRLPEVRYINQYHESTGYIDALAASVRQHWQANGRGERLLISFHGLPKRYLTAGDPYHCQCHATARRLAHSLELPDDQWTTAFQSRLGREEWLKPYTDHVLTDWGKKGIGKVDVICPGFSCDCLETLEEVKIRYQQDFLAAGGKDLSYIPALNDRKEHIAFLAGLVHRHSQGWPEAQRERNEQAAKDSSARTLERARALGAEN